MKIAFFGDSLTEGHEGLSYYDVLAPQISNHKLYNFGKGGDTVRSLYRRIQSLNIPEDFDVAVIWIGVNDILALTSRISRLLKLIRRQPWVSGKEEFQKRYQSLLHYLSSKSSYIITIPPLFIGENFSEKWNQSLGEYSKIIQELSEKDEKILFINLREKFRILLEKKPNAGFFPSTFINILKNRRKNSHNNKFHFTIDGVHLNQRGALIVAKEINLAISTFLSKNV